MGFSRYCPSSLDLTNFMVRSGRGAAAEPCPGSLWLTALNLEIQESGNLEPGNLEIGHPKKSKNIKIKIRSAQNVGKVWISRKKTSWPHLGPFQANFSWAGKMQKLFMFLPIFLGGPMGPIHPVWALAAIHPGWGNRYPNVFFLS